MATTTKVMCSVSTIKLMAESAENFGTGKEDWGSWKRDTRDHSVWQGLEQSGKVGNRSTRFCCGVASLNSILGKLRKP